MKAMRQLKRAVLWLGDHDPMVLASLLVVVASTWAFVELADEVLEGNTVAFDTWVVRALRQTDDVSNPLGPKWLEEAARDMTALGGWAVLSLMTAAVAGYLWLDDKHGAMWSVVAATVTGTLLAYALKYGFGRPRPDFVPHLSHVYTTSFPSGHSLMAAVVYLTLGSLLAAVLHKRSLKVYVICVALGLALVVGLSRIYMGVHYPTDVLAGWSLGLAWALLCRYVVGVLQRQGAVEA